MLQVLCCLYLLVVPYNVYVFLEYVFNGDQYNGVCQGAVLSPQLFNVYIDGLSDILNKFKIGGSLMTSV